MLFNQLSSFRTRSRARDLDTDRRLIGDVASALERTVTSMQDERRGLTFRLDDAVSRACIFVDTDYEAYLFREPNDSNELSILENEIQQARSRLNVIDQNLANLASMIEELKNRFPNVA